MFMSAMLLAQNTSTINVTISDFQKGSQLAENEKHDFGNGLVIYTTKCWFTTELRIYSSEANNGFVISEPLPGTITNISLTMGEKKDVLNVYGSTDGETWTLIQGIEVIWTSYENYSLKFPEEKGYTCFKFDVKGENQIRIESMSVTYIEKNDADNNEPEEGNGSDGGNTEDSGGSEDEGKEEAIVVSAPIFTPVSTSFSTESLDITIEAAKGCEIYYTKDGTPPSYTSVGEFVGTKSNVATIYASESKVTLQAIAVDPTTGKCSNISSATYTFIKNNGNKTTPYTVEELRAMSQSTEVVGKWVKGTIYGTLDNKNNLVTSNFEEYTNIVIGDEREYIAVQLENNNIREEINLRDHPYLKGKEILVQGTLEKYILPLGVGVKKPKEYKITYDVPINSYGYATLYLDMPVSVPEGCTAYYCVTEGDQVKLLSVGSIIPSNVGVVIKYTPNTTCGLTYTTIPCDVEQTIREDNQLIGFTQNVTISENGKSYYALNVKDNKLGFYIPQTANTDGTFIAKANKAYLEVPAEIEATMFLIHRENDETNIVSISHMSEDVIYDLLGREIFSPTPGIYIKAGKKVIVR